MKRRRFDKYMAAAALRIAVPAIVESFFVAFAGLVAKGLQTLGGPYADVLLGTPEPDKYDGKGYEK